VKSGAPSTHKKVVLRKLDKGLIKGYVNPGSYLTTTGIQMLDHQGRLIDVPLTELKGLFFVRDFEGDAGRVERKVFRSRPKRRGLWVRLVFRDNEVLEGIIPNNLLDLHPSGFLVIPPDLYSNNLKIFVPRGALEALEVLAVISGTGDRRTILRGSEARRAARIDLFQPSNESKAD